jgi:hypothetical protein
MSDRMNINLEQMIIREKWPYPISRYHSGVYLEGLKTSQFESNEPYI